MSEEEWLECNTLDGRWFYMNVNTGEMLPYGVQPLRRDVSGEKVIKEFEEKIENQGIALAEINSVVKKLKSKNNALKKENKRLKEQLKQRDEAIYDTINFIMLNSIIYDNEKRNGEICCNPYEIEKILTKYKGDSNE